MIKSILIKNFILIDELFLEFTDGFNVILGETGAGKSIIIKAIDTALGAKTSKDVLKNPDYHALIELTFEENGEKVISREISTTGTKCRINGALVSLDEIKHERERLIDIHTQFQTYTYIQQKYHIELLDSYIKAKESGDATLLNEHEIEYKRYIEVKRLLEKLQTEANTNTERIEFLKFQIEEIERAEIREGEEEELNKELEILSNVQELKELSFGAFWALGGEDGSVTEALSKIGYNISRIREFDPDMKDTEEGFFNALEILRDASSELRNYSDALEANPERLDAVNERLELIEKLKRKYGDIFESLEKFKNELSGLEKDCRSTEELEAEIAGLKESMEKLEDEITAARKCYAEKLSLIITDELKKLEFECPNFKIDVRDCPVNFKGRDNVEFMLTTNLSKEMAPLVKSASGGEISRVMLALKTIFAHVDNLSTVIFDEIDTGISGKTSVSVAGEISELSKTVQVFAITHQPIIASFAKSAFWVSKKQEDGNTKISVLKLDGKGMENALAQMSSGVIDDNSLSFARELLQR